MQMQPTQQMSQPFTNPRVGGGEPGPAISELDGRVVAFVVKKYDPNATDPAGKPKPAVTADVYVIDNGTPLQYGGNYSLIPSEQRLPYMQVSTPVHFANRIYSGVNIVRALQSEVGKAPVLGVIVRSEVGNRPWNLDVLADDDPRRAFAGQFWSAMMTGQWTNPIGVPIPGRPGPAGADMSAPAPGAPVPNPYAQPAPQQPTPQYLTQPAPGQPYLTQPAPQQPWQQPVAQPMPQAPPQQFQQQPAPQFQQFAPQQPMPQAPAPQFGPPQQAPQFAPQMQAAGAVYPDGSPMPPAPQGYEQVWPTLTQGQHAAILAQAQPAAYGQQQGQPNPW